MDLFTYRKIEDERAIIYQFGIGDQRETIAASHSALEHKAISTSASALMIGFDGYMDYLVRKAPDLSPEGFLKAARTGAPERLKAPFRNVRDDTREALKALEAREADWANYTFEEQHTPAVRAEQRGWARTRKLPELIAATEADPVLAAAIVEGGLAMSGLPADIFDRLKQTAGAAQAANRMMSSWEYRTEPNAMDPVGSRVDWDAARQAGNNIVAGLREQRETLESVSGMLAGVVTGVALVTDQRRDAAYTMLVG